MSVLITWSRSSQSTKIGKTDSIDIDCIDQSMTHSFRLFIYLDFTNFTDLSWKIHLFFCSSKNWNWFYANSEFVDEWVAMESQTFI